MRKMYQSFVPAIIVLLALVMSAFWIMPAHADDSTPPSTAPAVTQPQGGSSTTDQSTTKATTDSSPAPSGVRCACCESALHCAYSEPASGRKYYDRRIPCSQQRKCAGCESASDGSTHTGNHDKAGCASSHTGREGQACRGECRTAGPSSIGNAGGGYEFIG